MAMSKMKGESSLDLQRILALKTLSRADGTSQPNNKPSMSISYLLKPNESVQATPSSETLNPSNFFNISDMVADITPAEIMNDIDISQSVNNLSQSVQEILASSCLKNVQDSVVILEDNQSLQESKISDCFSIYSWQDAKKQQSFNDISFKSIKGDIEHRLLQDQEEWQQQYGVLPVHENENINTTNFSGIVPTNSRRKNFIGESFSSIGEYFQGSQNINSIIKAKTPVKKKPVALVDLDQISHASLDDYNTFTQSLKNTSSEKILPSLKNNSVASLSTIAKALDELSEKDSPRTIYNAMMKKTNKCSVEDDINKLLKNTDNSVIISGSIGIKVGKENSDSNGGSASSSTLNSTTDIGLAEKFSADLESTHIEDNLINNYNNSLFVEQHQYKINNEKSPSRIFSKKKLISNTSWIIPDKIERNVCITNILPLEIKKNNQNPKTEDSVIILCDDDDDVNSKKLDISIKANEVFFPINCLMYYSLKFISKSRDELYVKAKLTGLSKNKEPVELKAMSKYINIEMSEEIVYVEPQKENVLVLKVRGFVDAQMDFTFKVEGSVKKEMVNKKMLVHTFRINFYKPSIMVALAEIPQIIIKQINFGFIPSQSYHTLNLLVTKSCNNCIPLKIQIRKSKESAFAIVNENNFNVSECILEMRKEINLQIRFITSSVTCDEFKIHENILDIGIFMNGEFSILNSLAITGTECYSNILFNKDTFPLHLEHGEIGFVGLRNNGSIALTYKVTIVKDIETETVCTDDIFSVEQPEITIKTGDEYMLKVTLNKELINTTKRFILFRQTFNGPSLSWPVIGRSRSVQNYFNCFISPSRNNRVETERISPKLEIKESVQKRMSPTNLSAMSTFKLPCNKVSPAKSSHSSFSSGSAVDNRLPIRSMKTYVSWPSTKIGKSISQEVTIKNISDHRIKINLNILNNGFTISYNNETASSMSMILHGLEVRTFSIIFSPQRSGIYNTKIVFSDNRHNSRLCLPLVGFGGSSEVTISGVFKLPNGNRFLSLGQFSKVNNMKGNIQLFNKGSVPAFAQVLCDNSRNNFLFSTSEIQVDPEVMIIQPNTYKNVNVTFNPKKNFIHNYNGEVIELAALTIMTGDDGLRQRARQLYHLYPLRRCDKIWKKLHSLLVKMEDEPCYPDIDQIKEPIAALYDILAPIDIKEIFVTVENGSNTSSDSSVLCDESLMFQSLCVETISISDSDAIFWTFEPSKIIINLSYNNSGVIKITNSYDVEQKFEVTSHICLKANPSYGKIPAKSSIGITVVYVGGILKKPQSTILQIVAENEIIKIPVDINT